MTPSHLLKERQVLARVPFSKSTLHRKCRNGSFPRPIKLGERSVAWIENEIIGWEQARIAERDAEAAG